MNNKKKLHEIGFLHLQHIFSNYEILTLRNQVQQCIEKDDPELNRCFRRYVPELDKVSIIQSDIFCRFPQLHWILSHPPLVQALEEALGKHFYLNHESSLTQNYHYFPWHHDARPVEKSGLSFHLQKDFLTYQCAIYLQNNSKHYGGGIEVLPRSHLDSMENHPALWVPHQIGDILIWHMRLLHRASQPVITPLPPDYNKLVIYFTCSVNQKSAKLWEDWIYSRKDQLYRFFKRHHYSAGFQELITRLNINILSLK